MLNGIETLVAELGEMQDENQRLRDEIARLKGEKGKPNESLFRASH
jgi:cell division protein FtsB